MCIESLRKGRFRVNGKLGILKGRVCERSCGIRLWIVGWCWWCGSMGFGG